MQTANSYFIKIMKDNIVHSKSFEFALMVIEKYKELQSKNEFIISKQFLRSGTSIGANIEEAIGAHSKKDFFYRMSVAYKEALETRYWIKLLKNSKYLLDNPENKLFYDTCEDLCRILGKIQLTLKQDSALLSK